jgi:hypothetical protein
MTDPDERALVADLASVKFTAGVDRGWWRLVRRDGISVVFEVRAATGRTIGLRADFSCYPSQPPTAQLWDLETGSLLPVTEWPSGGRASDVFNPNWACSNDWAFYFPFDRRALIGHGPWAQQHPGHVWTATNDVADYLALVREVLRSATSPALAA